MQNGLPKRLLLIVIGLLATYVFCMNPGIALEGGKQPGIRFHRKAQIQEGKMLEAIQWAKEITQYINASYPEVFVSLYIEKSATGTIAHWFVDFKDSATYEEFMRQIRQDEKYGTLISKSSEQGLFIRESVYDTTLTSITAFKLEKPVANLTQGQEGKIFFSSINLGTFKEILAGEGESRPVTIFGTLSLPKNAKGKVPAVVIMHGAGGVNNHYFEMARILNGIGIAALIVDSWETRGIRSVQALKGKKLPHSFAIRISDAYASLELLSTHPKIDKRKIAIMGYSHGGAVALFVASEKIRYSFIADDLRFAASIAYYPFCFPQIKDIDFTDAPILMLLAEKDNMAPAKPCLDYARRIKGAGVDIKTIVYKNAHHQFPVLPGKKIIKAPEFADLSNCGQNEYWFLGNDGNWYSPYLKKTYAEADPGDIATDCKKDGEAIMGGNEEAKAKSIKESKAFLRRVFNLQ